MGEESKRDRPPRPCAESIRRGLTARSKTLHRWCTRKSSWFFLVSPGEYRGGKTFLPGSAISARTREFMNSVSMIIKWMSLAIWLWSPFDMRWFTSVLADDSVQRVGTCGCSRAKAVHGLPSGGQCLKWRKTPPNDGTWLKALIAAAAARPLCGTAGSHAYRVAEVPLG